MASLVAVLSGCTEVLPPPAAPSQEISGDLARRARAAHPSSGRGVVVLDTVGGSAQVTGLDAAEPACEETPCVVTLPEGEHPVVFHRDGRDDEATLRVTERPSAYRRVMSYDTGARDEYTALTASGLTLGGLLIGPLVGPLSHVGSEGTNEDVAVIAVAVASGALLVTGIVGLVLTITDPRRVREGSDVQWPLTFD